MAGQSSPAIPFRLHSLTSIYSDIHRIYLAKPSSHSKPSPYSYSYPARYAISSGVLRDLTPSPQASRLTSSTRICIQASYAKLFHRSLTSFSSIRLECRELPLDTFPTRRPLRCEALPSSTERWQWKVHSFRPGPCFFLFLKGRSLRGVTQLKMDDHEHGCSLSNLQTSSALARLGRPPTLPDIKA